MPLLVIIVLLIAFWVISAVFGKTRARRMHRDREAPDAAAWQRWSVPPLHSTDDLAAALGVTSAHLTWLLDRRRVDPATGVSCHYHLKRIPKANGRGLRELLAPKPRLKAAQRWILIHVLNAVAMHDAAHGFRRGRSIITNARAHAGKAVVVCADLRDFFPTITYPRVRGLFAAMGYGRSVATALALLCTTRLPHAGRRVLPQGAPTSPALSNMIAHRLDCRLTGLARQLGFTYTRYADDCTFSGEPRALGVLLRMVRRIVRAERFFLHTDKLRIHRRGACQQVTGLVVNAQPAVSRTERRRLRAVLHQARATGLEAQNRTRHADFTEYLRGKIAFISMVNAAHGAPLRQALACVIPPSAVAPSSPEIIYTPGPEQMSS